MRQLILYRQKRQDGGTRTAVMVDGMNVLHHFRSGKKPPDPALLWFLDVRCEGAHLPEEPEEVRQWFLDHAEQFAEALTELEEKLRAGLDYDILPLQWKATHPPKGTKVTIVCSSVRRVTALQMASIVAELREHWTEILESLEPLEAAAR